MYPPGDVFINMYPKELAVIDFADWLVINLQVPIVLRLTQIWFAKVNKFSLTII